MEGNFKEMQLSGN